MPHADLRAACHCDVTTKQDDPKQQSAVAAVIYRHMSTITRATRLTITRDGGRQSRPRVVDHYFAISSSGCLIISDEVMRDIAHSAFRR